MVRFAEKNQYQEIFAQTSLKQATCKSKAKLKPFLPTVPLDGLPKYQGIEGTRIPIFCCFDCSSVGQFKHEIKNKTKKKRKALVLKLVEPRAWNERDHLVQSLIKNTKAALSISFEGWDNDRNYLPCKLLELRTKSAHFLAHKRAFWRKQDKWQLL